VDYKEIRDSNIEDASEKFYVFNQSLCQSDDIAQVYNSQYFRIPQLSLEGKMKFSDEFFCLDLKEKHFIEEVIENEWNFKPLFSLKEDIDFPKVQQFEQHMFQMYNSILDSYVKFKSKQGWCQRVMEEIQMQHACANVLSSYASSLNKLNDNEISRELVQNFKENIRS
jgi:hypothetical protein